MKTRRKKKTGIPTGRNPRVTNVIVETPRVVTIRDLSEVETVDVTKAFVKLAPNVLSSDRAAFDVASLVRRLKQRGALVVVSHPVFVPDPKQRDVLPVSKIMKPREAVDEWFSKIIGVPTEVIDTAKETLHGYMDKEGL